MPKLPVGEISFLDLRTTYVPNITRNSNRGSIMAYSVFSQFWITGLIGALLISCFLITDNRAWNPKQPIVLGGKPALLFPIRWQIAIHSGWSRRKQKEGLFQGNRVGEYYLG